MNNLMFRKPSFLIPAFAVLCAAGCATFVKSSYIPRKDREAVDKKPAPPSFASVRVSWNYFPLKTSQDIIGSITEKKADSPIPVSRDEAAYLTKEALKILREEKVYDADKGTGTLAINLTSYGRWNYSMLWHTYLVDTPFVLILPSAIIARHAMRAEWTSQNTQVKVEDAAEVKSVFHLLLFPLYPFFSPGAQERHALSRLLSNIAFQIRKQQTESPQSSQR